MQTKPNLVMMQFSEGQTFLAILRDEASFDSFHYTGLSDAGT